MHSFWKNPPRHTFWIRLYFFLDTVRWSSSCIPLLQYILHQKSCPNSQKYHEFSITNWFIHAMPCDQFCRNISCTSIERIFFKVYYITCSFVLFGSSFKVRGFKVSKLNDSVFKAVSTCCITTFNKSWQSCCSL